MLWLYLITTNIFPFYILVSFLSFLNLILSNYFVLSHIQVVLRMVNIPKTVINSLLKKTLSNSRFREEEKTRGFCSSEKKSKAITESRACDYKAIFEGVVFFNEIERRRQNCLLAGSSLSFKKKKKPNSRF